MNKKRKGNRAPISGEIISRPGPIVPLEYLSPEEIAHCNGAPPLLNQEERRQRISILASRLATHDRSLPASPRPDDTGVWGGANNSDEEMDVRLR